MADNANLKMWREAARASQECLPLETLEQLTDKAPTDAKVAAHLDSCAHCQTELSLLRDFEQATPSADEGAAVAWIAAELERRQSAPAKQSSMAHTSFWRNLFRVPYLAGAAAVAAVLVLAVTLYNPTPGPGPIQGTDLGTKYRGGVTLLEPSGDLTQAPEMFRWEAVQGAAGYRVELTDALGQVLARAESKQPQIATTAQMKSAMKSGMPIRWKVTALDASGKSIAESSGGNFKLR